MKVYIKQTDGYVVDLVERNPNREDYIEYEVDSFPPNVCNSCYKLVDGEFILDEEKLAAMEYASLTDEEKYIRMTVNDSALTPEQALDVQSLYKDWSSYIGKSVKKPLRVNYRIKPEDDPILYELIQPHTPEKQFPPNIIPALWKPISLDEFPEWIQPLGSEHAYRKGDKVKHNDKKWISTADANVWEPGVYGWDEVVV